MTPVRFQGTDGVRRPVKLSSDSQLEGLSPQDVFLKHDVMTERFMELYTYCRVKWLIENSRIKEDDDFVIGWDPRDTTGIFTDAATEGILKAGCNALVVGIAPTPAVSVYMRSVNAAGSIVVTASHNPASYNGIKIFTRRGLKLLPGDDTELSNLIMKTDYKDMQDIAPTGVTKDCHDDMVKAFTEFSLDPRNSWIEEGGALRDITLIVDCANGACSGIAEKILQEAGFGKVLMFNQRLDGSVNVRSGVAELEGFAEIKRDAIEQGGLLFGNEAIEALFKVGKENVEAIKEGNAQICAAIFDGDGDRFFRVDYNPFTDSCFVLTGDETAVLQAEHRRKKDTMKRFVNTVESDLSAAIKARDMGYETELTAVGDKWILLEATIDSIRPKVSEEFMGRIESIAFSENPSSDIIEKLLDENNVELAGPEESRFALGAEESGHNITPGIVKTAGYEALALAGNGIKSCLNTFAATCQEPFSNIPNIARKLEMIRHPFDKGFKKTLYIFYVVKELWRRGGPLWNNVHNSLCDAMIEHWPEASIEEMTRAEDKDMLYIKIIENGEHISSVFVRNSGTEDKIGVTLRGPDDKSEKLLKVGEAAMRILLVEMKDSSKQMAQAELELMGMAAGYGVSEEPPHGLSPRMYERLLAEAGVKQGLLKSSSPGARLTERGRWYYKVKIKESL